MVQNPEQYYSVRDCFINGVAEIGWRTLLGQGAGAFWTWGELGPIPEPTITRETNTSIRVVLEPREYLGVTSGGLEISAIVPGEADRQGLVVQLPQSVKVDEYLVLGLRALRPNGDASRVDLSVRPLPADAIWLVEHLPIAVMQWTTDGVRKLGWSPRILPQALVNMDLWEMEALRRESDPHDVCARRLLELCDALIEVCAELRMDHVLSMLIGAEQVLRVYRENGNLSGRWAALLSVCFLFRRISSWASIYDQRWPNWFDSPVGAVGAHFSTPSELLLAELDTQLRLLNAAAHGRSFAGDRTIDGRWVERLRVGDKRLVIGLGADELREGRPRALSVVSEGRKQGEDWQLELPAGVTSPAWFLMPVFIGAPPDAVETALTLSGLGDGTGTWSKTYVIRPQGARSLFARLRLPAGVEDARGGVTARVRFASAASVSRLFLLRVETLGRS